MAKPLSNDVTTQPDLLNYDRTDRDDESSILTTPHVASPVTADRQVGPLKSIFSSKSSEGDDLHLNRVESLR